MDLVDFGWPTEAKRRSRGDDDDDDGGGGGGAVRSVSDLCAAFASRHKQRKKAAKGMAALDSALRVLCVCLSVCELRARNFDERQRKNLRASWAPPPPSTCSLCAVSAQRRNEINAPTLRPLVRASSPS